MSFRDERVDEHLRLVVHGRQVSARYGLPLSAALTSALVCDAFCTEHGPVRFSDVLRAPGRFGTWCGMLFEALRLGAYGCGGLGSEYAGRVLLAEFDDAIDRAAAATAVEDPDFLRALKELVAELVQHLIDGCDP